MAKTIALTVAMLGAALAVGADAVEHRDGQQAPTHNSVSALTIPNVPLLRADGQRLTLGAALDDDRPVVLNFIYTSCNSICPLLSAVLAQFREQLGAERASVHVVSISIDPEQDTPQELRAYAARFKGGPGWDYFTGSAAASVQVQRAFEIYRGEKMNHTPVTFIRPARGAPWTRIDGFASAEQLLHSYHQLVAAR
ncbi:MAG TPA: SCO family protein [Steroidobacteraceae bacterium]